MTMDTRLPPEERLIHVLRHLGLERAHFAGGSPADVAGLVHTYPHTVASCTLVCPARLPPQAVQPCADRLLVIVGAQGPPAAMVQQAVERLPGTTVVPLPQYFSPPWADAVADRTDEVGGALVDFLRLRERRQEIRGVDLRAQEGEVAGITYPYPRVWSAACPPAVKSCLNTMGRPLTPTPGSLLHHYAWRPGTGIHGCARITRAVMGLPQRGSHPHRCHPTAAR